MTCEGRTSQHSSISHALSAGISSANIRPLQIIHRRSRKSHISPSHHPAHDLHSAPILAPRSPLDAQSLDLPTPTDATSSTPAPQQPCDIHTLAAASSATLQSWDLLTGNQTPAHVGSHSLHSGMSRHSAADTTTWSDGSHPYPHLPASTNSIAHTRHTVIPTAQVTWLPASRGARTVPHRHTHCLSPKAPHNSVVFDATPSGMASDRENNNPMANL